MDGDSPPLALRQDLRLYAGPPVDHVPRWMLYDPVRHRYVQIDTVAYAVLAAWTRPATPCEIFAQLRGAYDVSVTLDDVERVFDFAATNELVEDAVGGWRWHQARADGARSSVLMWLVHNYLFIKIPVARPKTFFERTGFLVAPAFGRPFAITLVCAALVALYLVSRQWTAFVGTFPGFLSFDGLFIYGVTLFGVKLCHELGHACAAARYGCRVSSIGIAFMVMMPMLYCDVTDSWKLADRRQRMVIDCAGIVVEFILAVIGGLAWVILADGPLRTAAFLVASASLVSSLAINLNPFMRFDGYLILSDALNVPNLQSRAFGLLRWKLREVAFDLGVPKPETFSTTKSRLVLIYGFAIILYRAIVYTGIALLVYHAVFKLLGIALFTVEIGWFIVGPVLSEALVWWSLRDRIVLTRRSIVTGAIATIICALALFPFRTCVAVPAILEPALYAHVFPTTAGRVVSAAVQRDEAVVAGQTLVILTSPQIDQDEKLARIRLALVETRLERRASVAEDKDESLSLAMEQRLLLEKLDGLAREKQDLVIKSPIDGIVRDLDPDLDPGRWLGRNADVALVAAPGASVVRGYVRQDDLDRIAVGATGTFYPEALVTPGGAARLATIAYSAAARIDMPYLASMNGGPIAAREGADRSAVATTAIYPATFEIARPPGRVVERGTVLLQGRRESLAAGFFKDVARVLVRESGL